MVKVFGLFAQGETGLKLLVFVLRPLKLADSKVSGFKITCIWFIIPWFGPNYDSENHAFKLFCRLLLLDFLFRVSLFSSSHKTFSYQYWILNIEIFQKLIHFFTQLKKIVWKPNEFNFSTNWYNTTSPTILVFICEWFNRCSFVRFHQINEFG